MSRDTGKAQAERHVGESSDKHAVCRRSHKVVDNSVFPPAQSHQQRGYFVTKMRAS